MSMNEEEFASFLWALENTGLAWAVDDLRARDTAQREALARVEAERDEERSRCDALLKLHNNGTWEKAQAQLAEAVGLLRQIDGGEPLLDCSTAKALEAFLARHSQAEQQDDGRTFRFCQKLFDSAGECGNHVDQFHHGEAEQQEAQGYNAYAEAPYGRTGKYAEPPARLEQQEARNAEVARESLRPENQRIEPVEPLRVPHPLEAQGAQAGDDYVPEELTKPGVLAREVDRATQTAAQSQTTEFQREDRYIVIKRKDLEKVPFGDRIEFQEALDVLVEHLPERKFLVIESDWPEYEPTWSAIQARVEDRAALATQPAAGEPAPYEKPHDYYEGLGHVDFRCPIDLRRVRDHLESLLDAVPEGPLYPAPPAAAHGDEAVAVVGTVPDGSGFKSLDFKVDLQDLPDGTKLYAMRAQGDGEVQ